MKKLALILVFALASCGITGTATAKFSAKGRAFHSTVELQTPTGRTFCTGVITEHVILTAAHCTDNGETWAKAHDGSRFRLVLLRSMVRQDVATMVPADGRALGKGVRVARKAPGFADTVWVIGHSKGFLTNSITRGVVSHPRRLDGLYPEMVWLQHDAGSVGGNSGGPVLNNRGQLVGITSFGVLNRVICGQFQNCDGMYSDSHISGAVHLESIERILK